MIKTPTVLVLGAGASYPYGFPLASGLVDLICNELGNVDDDSGVEYLSRYFGVEPSDLVSFGRILSSAKPPSIDDFLEYRREFEKIGKLAIAYCLLQLEDPARLDPDSQRGEDW